MASNVGALLLLLLLAVWIGSPKAESLALLVEDEAIFRSSDGFSCPSSDPLLYYRPVIGILTHPGDGVNGRLSNATNASNIPASCVRFVESGGARVIPIIYNEPEDLIIQKLNLVNGVLLTGGWAKTGLYYDVAKKIFEIVLTKNDAGDHFPLLAVCLGFELLSMFISQNNDICERFYGEIRASTLQFSISETNGTLFERFPPDLLTKMSKECLAMQNHLFGISPKRLQENSALSSFFKILTTTADTNNEDYISTAQAYNYPVIAFQWHPEKNAFDWGSNEIPHSEDAVRVTQNTANYFISEARKSSSRPDDPVMLLSHLIYNHKPAYAGEGYDEVYIFT
ncbi:Peptidase C26 gamma-glutamyl hydrolase protein [Dioscorea alata]|uniref:Peptidase C26 gamma-glutamyl hydrolase protein n=1 Tax=Dioscorea alata TaxID=55571 RepID=A0ACB7WER1_DIOAL|nr:Peptidase C26 gamma-glutamyl hydrolase protein [Dioscorea alata]